MVDVFGFFGAVFSDLGEVFSFDKVIEDNKGGRETKRLNVGFVPIDSALNATWTQTTSPVFVCLVVMHKFWENHKKWPELEDSGEIKSLLDNLFAYHTAKQPTANFRKLKNSDVLNLFLGNIGTELSPVCAIVGGLTAQEIVRAICRNEEPLRNFFAYNALDGSGWVGEMFSPH